MRNKCFNTEFILWEILLVLIVPFIAFFLIATTSSHGKAISPYFTYAITSSITAFLLLCILKQTNSKDATNTYIEKASFIAGSAIIVIIGLFLLILYYFTLRDIEKINGLEGIIIICTWLLNISICTYILFLKWKQFEAKTSTDIKYLIGGWYVNEKQNTDLLPVLVFEKDYTATFIDKNRKIKNYSYHVCCNTCIILTPEEEEEENKIYVQRKWISGKPYLNFNNLELTQIF